MTHQAVVVANSVEVTANGGVAFTLRCCDDPASDYRVHEQRAGEFTAAELDRIVADHLAEAARRHAAVLGAADHVRRLAR